MAKTDFKSVDEYIATHQEDVQAILQRVRMTIRKAMPDAEEVISYQIPAYKLQVPPCSTPATDHLLAALKDDFALYKVSKGTIRFPLSQPVPVRLIERIAKFRAKEAAKSARAKLAGPKKR